MIFIIFIVELFVFSFFRHLATSETSQNVIGTLFVLSNSAVLFAYLVTRTKSAYLQYFVIGIACRLFLLFADCYGWFYVPHTGWDTEVFARIARTNFENGGYFGGHGGGYVYVITTLYFVVGPIRMIAQYLNVVFGVGIMLVGLQIFKELDLDEKRKRLGMLLLAVFPHLCIFSAILLREAPIQFFLALSTLFFIRWMKNKGSINFHLSFLCILGAVWFHYGCIFWCAGYLVAMLFYRPNFGKNTFSPVTIAGAILAAALAVVACTFFMDSRVGAMAEGLSEGETVVSGENVTAGSAYLTWLTISNPYVLILFSPLKMFYFLYSPIPFDWRGLQDIIAFVCDSTFYIWASWVIWKNYRKRQGLPKNISRCLGITLLFMTFAFAFGTVASGTAIRHRCKFMPELVVVALLLSPPAMSRGLPLRRFNQGPVGIPPPPSAPAEGCIIALDVGRSSLGELREGNEVPPPPPNLELR